MKGKIVKALSGFYYVASGDETVECRARGKFRQTGQSPLVGDDVTFSLQGGKGTVEEILPRRNAFVRPAVANVDCLVIFASDAIPVTDPFLIDRVTALAENQGISCVICVNKTDLAPAHRLTEIYRSAGYPVVRTSAATGEGVEELLGLIRGKTVAFTGNSGVGKSAILHCLCPALELQTGAVSEKLGRGRHTTRHIELYALGSDTFVADTPGFSSFDVDRMEHIEKERLQYVFPDFQPHLGHCRFPDCSHRSEPDCGIRAALSRGELQSTRYRSYVRLYEAASQIQSWELK